MASSSEENELLEEYAGGASAATRSNLKRTRAPLAILAATALVACMFAFTSIRSPGASDANPADPLNLEALFVNFDSEKLDPQFLNYSNSGLPKDVIRKLLTVKKENLWTKHDLNLEAATCAVDATQSAYFLERAALAITAATASCKPGKSKHVQAACAADISGVLAALSFVAEYISESVMSCSQTIQLRAECSSGIAGIIANTARMATQASFMAANCKNGGIAYDAPVGDSVWQMTRRLVGEENSIRPTYDERGMEIATCALDATQTATYLAMFGIAIDKASGTCDETKIPKNPIAAGIVGPYNKAQCVISVFDILESVFMASSFISSAVSHCSPSTDQQALCASGAVGFAGAISGVLKNSLDIVASCKSDEEILKVEKGLKAMGDLNKMGKAQRERKKKSDKFWGGVFGKNKKKGKSSTTVVRRTR